MYDKSSFEVIGLIKKTPGAQQDNADMKDAYMGNNGTMFAVQRMEMNVSANGNE